MASHSVLPSPPALTSLTEAGPVALFLDFDGTLVELAPTPDSIQPTAGLAAGLEALSARLEYRCAMVSGRALSDIERHIGPVALAGAGSHGADIRGRDRKALGAPPEGLPHAIETELRAFADQHGLGYEAKPHGGALHYRAKPDAGQEADEFAIALAAEHGWKAQTGKCVVELVKGEANKGTAVSALMKEPPFAGSRPVFIGDDLTDEAGFVVCRQLGGFGILVGTREPTEADFQLPDVASVHAWLDL